MLYKIWKGSVATYQKGQDPLVYMVSSLSTVDRAGLSWVGSDGNMAVVMTEQTGEWLRLDQIVDWPLMKARMWNDTENDGDRMRRRMAELLVHKFFPLDCVEYLVVRTKHTAEAAESCVQGKMQVHVRPEWYYS